MGEGAGTLLSDAQAPPKRKLIEVALPLEAINREAAREKSIRHGHPSTLHLWWARRPLAAARAVIFCQMVDDPSAVPEEFPTEEAQENERLRLFALISELVQWENTTNEEVLNRAREEIRRSWRRCCADNADHPEAAELFNPEKLPGFHDPFAGGGALPLEAQRLGLEAYASDLNPVAVLINKAMIEIPPKFKDKEPIHPGAKERQFYRNAEGLAEDVKYYGEWVREKAWERIGHLYPRVELPKELGGGAATVIAWIWARTVPSPDPAFSDVKVPIVSSFLLSSKPGKEAWVDRGRNRHAPSLSATGPSCGCSARITIDGQRLIAPRPAAQAVSRRSRSRPLRPAERPAGAGEASRRIPCAAPHHRPQSVLESSGVSC